MTYKERFLNEIKRRLRDNMLSYQKDKRPQFNKLGRIMEDEDLLSFIDSMQEESDGDNLGVIATRDALAYANDIEDECINIDDVVQAYEDGMIAGAQWQKQQDSIPSKDLAEFIGTLSKRYPEVSFAKLSRIAVHVAKWQEKQTITDACELLRANLCEYFDASREDYDNFIDDFRKVMED